VAQSSSAKKVARLASKGKGKKVRFTGGTLFPAVMVGVTAVLLALVVYSRQTLPASGEGSPRANTTQQTGDHWHASYGLYTCDTYQPNLIGNIEETEKYQGTGVHSHDDGVIHWHAFTSRASGNRARLKVFLDNYGIKLSGNRIELPAEQAADGENVWDTGSFKCNGQDTQVKVRVWESYANPNEFRDVVTDFGNIRVDKDGMVFAIAIVPRDADVPLPPSAPNLPELGASDGGNVPTTVPAGGSTSTPASDGGSTTTPGSAPTSDGGPTTTPTTSAAATTTGG
jgi:hypothetical protein